MYRGGVPNRRRLFFGTTVFGNIQGSSTVKIVLAASPWGRMVGLVQIGDGAVGRTHYWNQAGTAI